MKKKTIKPEMKMIYTYEEPKTKEEAMLAEANLTRAYEIIFEETEKRLKAKGITLNW